MAIEVRISNASVTVSEPKEVYVKWQRGANKIETSKKQIEAGEKKKVEWGRKEAMFAIKSRLT